MPRPCRYIDVKCGHPTKPSETECLACLLVGAFRGARGLREVSLRGHFTVEDALKLNDSFSILRLAIEGLEEWAIRNHPELKKFAKKRETYVG